VIFHLDKEPMVRIWTLSFVALLSSSSALAAEPEAGPPSEVPAGTAAGATADTPTGAPAEAAQEAAEGAAAEALPPGFADLTPEVRDAILAMDQAALDALMQKAQQGQTLDAREQAIVDGVLHVGQAKFESELSYQTGDIAIADGLATLHLGAGFRYLGPADTERLLVEGWGNPPGMAGLGMIVPGDISPLDEARGWGVVITYSEDGYVEDDDADDMDYDELLEEMKEATEANNEARVSQGYEPMHLVGWAEPPHYDNARHSLYWAKELDAEGAKEHSLNYAIRVLGRRGVLELNAVAGMSQLAQIKPEMEKIYAVVEYQPGHRYSDFDPDIDEVAAYGIGALIAGKAAAKVGLWAVIVKFLIAAKKALIFVVLGLIVFVKKFLGMRRKEEDAPAPQEDAPAPQEDAPPPQQDEGGGQS
jgi:uncharacterized membrane-anchored protein